MLKAVTLCIVAGFVLIGAAVVVSITVDRNSPLALGLFISGMGSWLAGARLERS